VKTVIRAQEETPPPRYGQDRTLVGLKAARCPPRVRRQGWLCRTPSLDSHGELLSRPERAGQGRLRLSPAFCVERRPPAWGWSGPKDRQVAPTAGDPPRADGLPRDAACHCPVFVKCPTACAFRVGAAAARAAAPVWTRRSGLAPPSGVRAGGEGPSGDATQ